MAITPAVSSALPLSSQINDLDAKNSKERALEISSETSVSLLNSLESEALKDLPASVLNGLSFDELGRLKASVFNGLSPETMADLNALVINKLPPEEVEQLEAAVLNNLCAGEISNLSDATINNLSSEAGKALGAHVLNNLSLAAIGGLTASVLNHLLPETLEKIDASVLNNLKVTSGIKASVVNGLSTASLYLLNGNIIDAISNAELSELSAFTLISLQPSIHYDFTKERSEFLAPEAKWALKVYVPSSFDREKCRNGISAFDDVSNEIISQFGAGSFRNLNSAKFADIKHKIFKGLPSSSISAIATKLKDTPPEISRALHTAFIRELLPHRAKSISDFLNDLDPGVIKYFQFSQIINLSTEEIGKLKSSVINNLSLDDVRHRINRSAVPPKKITDDYQRAIENLSQQTLWELDHSTTNELLKTIYYGPSASGMSWINHLAPDNLNKLEIHISPRSFRTSNFEAHTIMGLAPHIIQHSNHVNFPHQNNISVLVGTRPTDLKQFPTDIEKFVPPSPETPSYSYIVSNLSESVLLRFGGQMLPHISDAGAIHVLRRFSQEKHFPSSGENKYREVSPDLRNLVNTIFISREDKTTFQDAVEKACPHASALLSQLTH